LEIVFIANLHDSKKFYKLYSHDSKKFTIYMVMGNLHGKQKVTTFVHRLGT